MDKHFRSLKNISKVRILISKINSNYQIIDDKEEHTKYCLEKSIRLEKKSGLRGERKEQEWERGKINGTGLVLRNYRING